MKNLFGAIFLSLFLSSFSLFAQENNNIGKVKFLVDAGIEFGGDDILEVIFTTGETQSIKAGQGGYLAVGGQYQPIQQFMARASVGIKFTTTAADNASIRLTRIPLNLTGFFMATDDIRVGIGATTYQNINLKGDGFLPDTEFTSKLGPKFEIGYRWFGLSYTLMEYTDPNNEVYDANAIGISVSFVFPNK